MGSLTEAVVAIEGSLLEIDKLDNVKNLQHKIWYTQNCFNCLVSMLDGQTYAANFSLDSSRYYIAPKEHQLTYINAHSKALYYYNSESFKQSLDLTKRLAKLFLELKKPTFLIVPTSTTLWILNLKLLRNYVIGVLLQFKIFLDI